MSPPAQPDSGQAAPPAELSGRPTRVLSQRPDVLFESVNAFVEVIPGGHSSLGWTEDGRHTTHRMDVARVYAGGRTVSMDVRCQRRHAPVARYRRQSNAS